MNLAPVASPGPVSLHHVYAASVTFVKDTCVQGGGHTQYGGKKRTNISRETAIAAHRCCGSRGWFENKCIKKTGIT